MTKYSKQRELIYNAVVKNKIHPTADFIYNSLKKEYPALSLGTVYRNLQQLTENGKVIKLHIPSKPDRYDGNVSPHYHTLCKICGEVPDVFIKYFDEIDKKIEEKIGNKVISHNITVNIICDKCNCSRLNEAI